MSAGDAERRLARLAARQHMVATRAQLAAIGISRHSVRRRAQSGRFVELQPGVLLVAPVAAPFTAHAAAVLSCGAGAALSHRAALEVHGLAAPRLPLDVTVPRATTLERPGAPNARLGAR